MDADLSELKRIVPDSVLPYPERPADRVKYFFWRMVFPRTYRGVRDGLLSAGIIKHGGRQHYPLGRLSHDKNMTDFLEYMREQGFGNHFVAWEDEEELIGLRKLDGFDKQYHIRVFRDGELRGHYEYTPESHWLWHLTKFEQEERREAFLKLLGGWVEIDRCTAERC